LDDNYKTLHKVFVEELSKLNSNWAGCKHFVHGSFIAYPEKYIKNPLVINSFLIGNKYQFQFERKMKLGLMSSRLSGLAHRPQNDG